MLGPPEDTTIIARLMIEDIHGGHDQQTHAIEGTRVEIRKCAARKESGRIMARITATRTRMSTKDAGRIGNTEPVDHVPDPLQALDRDRLIQTEPKGEADVETDHRLQSAHPAITLPPESRAKNRKYRPNPSGALRPLPPTPIPLKPSLALSHQTSNRQYARAAAVHTKQTQWAWIPASPPHTIRPSTSDKLPMPRTTGARLWNLSEIANAGNSKAQIG